jgi:hypothetical protein
MHSRLLFLPLLRRTALALALTLAGSAVAADPPRRNWTFEQMETFLARAEIVCSRPVAEGVTHTQRATLSGDGGTHDAQIQQVNISKPAYRTAKGWEANFRDYWGYNVAAYRLSRMLQLDCVPVSVRREIEGEVAAVTWWIDDVLMTEKTRFVSKLKPPDVPAWNRQMYTVRVFDELISNSDRNLANLVITQDWKIWMIDHTRAFRLHQELEAPTRLGMCERELLDALRKLDRIALNRELGDYLGGAEVDALLSRRDRIVEHFERQAAERGEQEVLFDREP